MVVHVEDVFFPCSTAFLRAGLWDPSTWEPHVTVPRRAVLAHDVEPDERTLAELDEYHGPSYEDTLHR